MMDQMNTLVTGKTVKGMEKEKVKKQMVFLTMVTGLKISGMERVKLYFQMDLLDKSRRYHLFQSDL